MDYCSIVKEYKDDICFSNEAFWIDSDDCSSYEWYAIKFNIEKTNKAIMLISAAEGAEIYINGILMHRFVTRSYIYNKIYDAIDFSNVPMQDTNEIIIITTSQKNTKNRGVIFEIITDKNAYISGQFKAKAYKFQRLAAGISFMIKNGCGDETYNSTISEFSSEVSLSNVSKIYDKPFEKMSKSILRNQTYYTTHPESICCIEKFSKSSGQAFKLSGLDEGSGIGIFYSTLSLENEAKIKVYIFSGVTKMFIDGCPLPENNLINLAKGNHLVTILGSAPQVYFDTHISFSDWTVCSLKNTLSPKRRFPWNDLKYIPEIPLNIDEVLANTSIDTKALNKAIVSDISYYNALKVLDYYSANDGISMEILNNYNQRKHLDNINVTINDKVIIHPSNYGTCITYDFKSEVVGYLCINVNSKQPIKLDIHCFEVINENSENYMNEKNHIVFTSNGNNDTYISHCRRGYRYVKVFVDSNNCDVELELTNKSSHYPVEYPTFNCNDKLLENIHKMCLDTAKVCSLDYYVDCPGHEQNVWVGDARITALVNLVCFGEYELDKAFLKLVGDSMSDKLTEYYRTNNPRYVNRRFLPCATFPTYPDGNIAVWSYQWILAVYDYYEKTADLSLLRELLPSIEETLSRSIDWYSDRGLLSIDGTWNLVDWANNDLSEYGEVSVNNMMLKSCFEKASIIETLVGNENMSVKYYNESIKLKKAINKYCYDEKLNAYVDTVRDNTAYNAYLKRNRDPIKKSDNLSEEEFAKLSRISVQTATFAILYDIAEGDRLEHCKKILIDNVSLGNYVAGTPANRTIGFPSISETPDGIVKIGSPFFMFFALEALYKIGEFELCEKAILRDFGDMLNLGIYNCTEVFNAKNKITTRSICHGWSSSPAYFISEHLLGVKALEAGYKKFTVSPQSAQQEASGTIRTPYGNIYVSWTKTSSGYNIECTYPKEIQYEGTKNEIR